MYILRTFSRVLERTSPVGIFIGGAVLALSIPPVRRALRAAAVSATAGVLTLTDRVQDMMAVGQEKMGEIVAEARMPQITSQFDDQPALTEDDRPTHPEDGRNRL